MPDYEKMYHIMFNAATDAERLLSYALESIKYRNFEDIDSGETATMLTTARNDLQTAQIKCENLYLDSSKIQYLADKAP